MWNRELACCIADKLDEWLIPNHTVSAVQAKYGSSKSIATAYKMPMGIIQF